MPDHFRATKPKPFVRQAGDVKSLYFSLREIQSRMSMQTPDALDLEYTRMMMGFLLFLDSPHRMLMIGLGGGSLPKFCHRYLPQTRIDVVEIDPEVIALRDEFQVPRDSERFTVIQDDGAAYLRRPGPAVDVLMVDGFDDDGLSPQLATPAFYADCRARLAPDGIMVVNLHVNRDHYAPCLARIRQVFGPAVLEVIDDDLTNSVVYARRGSPLDGRDAVSIQRPAHIAKDAWRQLMPTFRIVVATQTLR